jgi:hypothetical protein
MQLGTEKSSQLFLAWLVPFFIVFVQNWLGFEISAAKFAPKSALGVFSCNVAQERFFACQNQVAHRADRFAGVNLKVLVAVVGRAVRLIAHAANKPPVRFHNLITNFFGSRRWNPSRDGQDQRVACKFQVALVPCQKRVALEFFY